MITWFKELFMLVGMLFNRTHYPQTREVEMVITKNFPFEGYSYMAWCGKVVTRKQYPMSEETTDEEIFHLKQASYYKWWWQYYLVYVWEWIKGNPIMAPASSAYYTIPFEMQAQANRGNSYYEPTREDLKNIYTIKNRKRTYKENRYNWKEYLKSL